ncbi:hypothetical protein JW898_05445 [Candidatus Woesearchaeota archaeon]|nr:hypothetical protein [Candidatus Woesearchaeota archaeon]
MDDKKLSKMRKNNRTKTVIGLLLLIAVAYFLLTNFSIGDWPKFGAEISGASKSCIDVRGPKIMTDTVVEQLKVDDEGFVALRNENKAVLTLKNRDDEAGEVRVTVFCRNGDQQGEQKKKVEPGETAVFNFLDVADCDLDYIIEPELTKKRVNRTVYVTDSVCD